LISKYVAPVGMTHDGRNTKGLGLAERCAVVAGIHYWRILIIEI